MTYAETLQQERLTREIKQARKRAERAEETAEVRVLRDSQRAEQVARAVVDVTRGTSWPPPWKNLEDLARAAYATDGLQVDAWFGEQSLNKSGKPKGFERFRISIRSDFVTAVLADQGVRIHITKDGAGIPDREAVVEYHQRERERIEQSIERANRRAEQDTVLFGIEIPPLQLRMLTDGQ